MKDLKILMPKPKEQVDTTINLSFTPPKEEQIKLNRRERRRIKALERYKKS